MSALASTYRGRFAPSPTGPLHLGSLIAALASYLDARANAGIWLVRMEDLDPPREEAGAADRILHSLQQHGLVWDEQVLFQSERAAAYQAALQRLRAGQHLFECNCSRRNLGAEGACITDCRDKQDALLPPTATRINVEVGSRIEFHDQVQSWQSCDLSAQSRDFIVRRKDGLNAYQLAVVVDDAYQAINHIVRGSDLLDSTPRQIYLQRVLGYPTPSYAHIPVISDIHGKKFSKQHHAPALSDHAAADNVRRALHFLEQPPPPSELKSTQDILAFAVSHWSIERIPARAFIPA
ncbi:MAG: tRNA glutamyl-Q(34) synthetase GluQRS [Pseudomonadota bacterium]